jgi:hypothetical protein
MAPFAAPGTVGLDDRVSNGTLDMIEYDFSRGAFGCRLGPA